MDRIVALIPAYNEARRVAEVVAGARTHLPVWVVDDGSTDDITIKLREESSWEMKRCSV